MANEKTTIELETLNGNKIYPEIDTSKLTGQIAENNTGFATGGDVYTALTSKADKSDIVEQKQANWWETDTEDPSYIQHKPTLYVTENYNEEDYRADAGKQPQYVYNCHEITTEEINAKKFIVRLPLSKYDEASNIRLMGDIYSIRGLPSLRGSGSAINLKSGEIDSIELVLGDYYGNKLTNEPTIRIIDSTELAKSDINYGYDSLSQCRFHFSHFGSCSSSATKITSTAESLLIIVNLSSSTSLKSGNVFQILVNWVQF